MLFICAVVDPTNDTVIVAKVEMKYALYDAAFSGNSVAAPDST